MSAPTPPPRVFLSYRRQESSYSAGWLYEILKEEFGADRVFLDIDSIRPGTDFRRTIHEAVESSDVLVALIGSRWLTSTKEGGRRPLDDPDDPVRLEIEWALRSGVWIVPVLLDTSMPRVDELPEPLQDLARRNAVRLRTDTFRSDAVRLIEDLRRVPLRDNQVRDIPAPPRIHVEPGPVRPEEAVAPATLHRRPPVPRPPSVPVDVDTLAALLSPASRVEPELLRAVRLECLPELPVDAEQELWFSPLVDARSDGGITFAPEELRELRGRLRALYAGDARALVERAQEVQGEVHAGVSPLLRLEEELAWHEVVGDAAGAVEAADVAVRAVAARRDGVVHWVERVWATLPESVRGTPSGWVLGHVAGAHEGLPDTPGRLADHHLAALLATADTARLAIARAGSLLRLGVALDEAEATLDLPDTWPRVVEVETEPGAFRRVLVGAGEVVEVSVGDRPVQLRTLAGDVYVLGDTHRELLDSVLLSLNGTWCVTRVGETRMIIGHADGIAGALELFPAGRTLTDVATLVDRVGHGAGAGLLAVVIEDFGPSFAARVGDPSTLPVRERGPLEPGMIVRTIHRAPTGTEVVALRATEVVRAGLVGLDGDTNLVVGAPLVDDDDRLVGVVAPTSWTDGPSAVSWGLLDRVGEQRGMSQQLLRVQARTSTRNAMSSPEFDELEFSGGAAARAARDATSLWLAVRGRNGSGELVSRFDHIEVTTGLVRRRVRATQPERLPPNDATMLLDALGATPAGTTRLLTEDEARLVEAFAAGLRQPVRQEPRPAAVGQVLIGVAPAARVGDVTAHPGVVAPPGVPTVLINGRPAATVATATHICSFPPPAVHPPSQFFSGRPTVLIGGSPALRMGDIAGCGAVIVG